MTSDEKRKKAAIGIFERNSDPSRLEGSVWPWDDGTIRASPRLREMQFRDGELPILACDQGGDVWVVITSLRTTSTGGWSVDHDHVVAIKPAVMVLGEYDDPEREALVLLGQGSGQFRFLAGKATLIGVLNALLYCVRSVKGL